MTAQSETVSAESGISPAVGVPHSNSDTLLRSQRLKQAIDAAGWNKAVAARAGVPLSTLNAYLAGRDMPAGNLVALADACGVTVEWLATGRGPMRPGETPPAPATAPSPAPQEPEKSAPRHLPAFGTMDVDLLAECAAAIWKHVYGPELRPDWRPIVQATLVLYDQTRAIRANVNKQNDDMTVPGLRPGRR